MLIALILMFIVVLVLAWFLRREQNEKTFWKTSFHQLDIGFSEVTDAYESDSLQYEDTIDRLGQEILHVEAIGINELVDNNRGWTKTSDNAYRTMNGKIERRNATIQTLTEENAGIRKQLDIAQVIISEHDKNCLPHIVLSSMERETKVEPPPDWKKMADAMKNFGQAVAESKSRLEGLDTPEKRDDFWKSIHGE